MRVSKTTGRPYCFQPDRLYVSAGSSVLLMGKNQYELARPGKMGEDDIYLALTDICRLMAPDFTYRTEGENAVICFEGQTVQGTDVKNLDGEPAVGIRWLLCSVMGKDYCWHKDILVISLDGCRPDENLDQIRVLKWKMSHKEMGDLYRTLWLCEAGMLNSYRLYVPTGWKYEKKKKMLIYLHGAGGDENSGFERSHNRIQYLAEKKGYLVLAPNSLVHRSNFGGTVPPSGLFAKPGFTDEQGNLQYYSQADIEENAVAQAGFYQILDLVMKEYQVDPGYVFLMGNSMGGIGTFHLGGHRPEIFRGLIPCGALPEPSVPDWKRYGSKPILFIAGTEDHNGYEKMRADFAYIASQGVNIRMLTVGGGAHSDAWTMELETVFDFCENI
ncbi:hypothetical protein GPL15_18130 [Clostridium sp. MCC353]|uniref:hypothetical protein n=1 Tax=Clostridium sp. MCC353 TaxID=2592646 RepID=UPI001C0267C2|nr:hypothetical protein [Clostridium sp. MCC353]MBT9778419.1 hypothetical protein [Clostridium sp. MCC353]